jgi:hypothetical protein
MLQSCCARSSRFTAASLALANVAEKARAGVPGCAGPCVPRPSKAGISRQTMTQIDTSWLQATGGTRLDRYTRPLHHGKSPRLHWWAVRGENGETTEFASVGVHDDTSIPE